MEQEKWRALLVITEKKVGKNLPKWLNYQFTMSMIFFAT